MVAFAFWDAQGVPTKPTCNSLLELGQRVSNLLSLPWQAPKWLALYESVVRVVGPLIESIQRVALLTINTMPSYAHSSTTRVLRGTVYYLANAVMMAVRHIDGRSKPYPTTNKELHGFIHLTLRRMRLNVKQRISAPSSGTRFSSSLTKLQINRASTGISSHSQCHRMMSLSMATVCVLSRTHPEDKKALLEYWETVKAQHMQSRCRQQSLDMIRARRPHDGWGIEAAVIFGTGFFWDLIGTMGVEIPPEFEEEYKADLLNYSETAMLQLLAFLDLVEEVQKDARETIPMFAQDPGYMPLDAAFLAGLGIRIVDDPTGQRLLKRDVLGFDAGAGLDCEAMGQCPHLQPKVWVGQTGEFIMINGEGHRIRNIAEDPTAEPRLRDWAKDVCSFQARHEKFSWPEDDIPPEISEKSGHRLEQIWFETADTRQQMDRMKLEGASCEGCVGGRRSACTMQFDNDVEGMDMQQSDAQRAAWVREAASQTSAQDVLDSLRSQPGTAEAGKGEDD